MVASPAMEPVSRPRNFGFFSKTHARIEPRHGGKGGGEVRVQESGHGDLVHPKLASRIEPVPAEPEKPRAQGDEGNAVRSAVLHVPRADEEHRGQRREAREAWTTMPPAKSRTPHCASRPSPQIMCTSGKYTRMSHTTRKMKYAGKRTRLAKAPGDQRRGDDGEHHLVDDEGEHRDLAVSERPT